MQERASAHLWIVRVEVKSQLRCGLLVFVTYWKADVEQTPGVSPAVALAPVTGLRVCVLSL